MKRRISHEPMEGQRVGARGGSKHQDSVKYSNDKAEPVKQSPRWQQYLNTGELPIQEVWNCEQTSKA